MAALALRGFAINEILRRHTVHYRCERVAKDSRDLHWLERFPRVLFSVGFFFGVACTVPVARDQYTALFWRASSERLSDCTIDNDGRDYCLIKSTLFSLSSLFFWKKKWSTHRKSERCRTILNHFIKSTFKWMCTFFRYTLRKNNFSLKKTYNKPSTC